jgi:hypothetical protein
MNAYRPDWVGLFTTGIAIGLSVLIATRIWPSRDGRNRVVFIAIGIGVILSIFARSVLRRFGI